VTWH